jgi:hypothetical protein
MGARVLINEMWHNGYAVPQPGFFTAVGALNARLTVLLTDEWLVQMHRHPS